MSRTMEWRTGHLGGIPRKLVITAVGAFAKTVTYVLNTTTVYNPHILLDLVRCRPPPVPLITVSNHMSTLDDPVMWVFPLFPIFNTKLARWVLAAEDICFKNSLYSYIFRLGKCIPITRGGGIYQEHMSEALECLSDGEWVMPEKYMFGRRPPLPLCNKNIDIVIGDPIEFDLPTLKQKAISQSRTESFPTIGWPTSSDGLDEAAQRCLYIAISEQIRAAMERLRCYGKSFQKS